LIHFYKRIICNLKMNFDYKILVFPLALVVAVVYTVPVLPHDEDDGGHLDHHKLDHYANFTKEDLLVELLELKKKLNESDAEETTHTRRRRSSGQFQFPLDVCGTIPQFRGRIRSGGGGLRIVGGKKTRKGQIPWQIGLYKRRKNRNGGGDLFLMCGGAMVTPHAAITASHCLKEDPVINGLHQYQAWAGRTVSAKDKVDTEMRFIVKEYFKHPQYNKKTLQNDIAVLSLETEDKQPFAWTQWVRPVCLPDPHPRQKELYRIGEEAIVSGFGLLKESGTSMSSSLQHVKLDITDLEDCKEAYEGTSAIVDEKNFCAAKEGKDACTGDSGGPMVAQGEDDRYYLIGVVSFGKGCARKDIPGVYARVDKFINWVKGVVEGIESGDQVLPTESPIAITSSTCPTPQTCPPRLTCPSCRTCPPQSTRSPRRTTCPPPTIKTCPTCKSCPPLKIVPSTSTCPPQTTTTCPTCKACPPQQSCPDVCAITKPSTTRQPCPSPQPCPTCETCPQTWSWSSQQTTIRPTRRTSLSPSTCQPCETCQSCPPQQSCPICETCKPQETNSLLQTLLLAQQWQQSQTWQQIPTCPQCPPQRACPQVSPVTTLQPQTRPATRRPPQTRPTTRQPPQTRPTTTRPKPENEREIGPVCTRMRIEARCGWGEVIRVTEGYFGRHEGSKTCPESQLLWFQRSLGCFHQEATRVMASKCNGRRRCFVSDMFFQNSHCDRPYALMKFACERSNRSWNNWSV